MVLSFRLGRIPVRVHPVFFVMALVLGGLGGDVRTIAAWVAIVFVSVLLHELGHATMGIALGLAPQIDLHGMGGTTSWSGGKEKLTYGKRVAISLAGPFAGFVVGAVVFGLHRAGALPPHPLVEDAYATALWVNVGWGVLNLAPMLPLDGGNVMLHVLNALTGGEGEKPARIISIAMAALATALALVTKQWWPVLLGGSFVMSNWQGLRAVAAREHDAPMRAALEQAYAALDARDAQRVLALARPVAMDARTAPVRAEALQLLAFGFLLEGRVADADAAIAALPQGFAPHPSLVEMRAAHGRS